MDTKFVNNKNCIEWRQNVIIKNENHISISEQYRFLTNGNCVSSIRSFYWSVTIFRLLFKRNNT